MRCSECGVIAVYVGVTRGGDTMGGDGGRHPQDRRRSTHEKKGKKGLRVENTQEGGRREECECKRLRGGKGGRVKGKRKIQARPFARRAQTLEKQAHQKKAQQSRGMTIFGDRR